ncbi:putative Alpha-1,2-mannosidase [Trichophyton rubrum]|nr:putative Alpha-1,2-mannosidase [Trichophyton rubrum]
MVKYFPSANAKGNDIDLTQYVDLFIGTEGSVAGTSYNGGNVFPGAAHDVDEKRKVDVNAGYSPDGNVSAISFMHESGTGGAPKYGVISQMPLSTLDRVDIADNRTYMQPRVGKDSASVGYYKTRLRNGITVEMSATDHAGILQYTYPPSTGKFVLVDLSHYLPTHGEPSANQMYSNGKIDIQDGGRTYTGYGIYRGGWNEGPNFQVFMCAEFDIAPTSAKTWRAPYTDPYDEGRGEAKFSNQQTITGGREGYQYADRIGAIFEFPSDTRILKSRIGISFISTEKACQFTNEIRSWNMNDTVNDTKGRWNSEVLSTVTTSDTNTTRRKMLYSALYRSHLLPSNRTGENPYWESAEPYYDDYYAIWDTFRCLNSFYLLTKPQFAAETIRSLIDIWRFERFMPDGRSGNANGRVQGGSNADNILADAYVKGLQKGVNWTDGYLAMRTDAEVVPYNNFGPADLTGSTKEGRGALLDWLQYGYVTPSFGRSISRTVEYSLNDFALSQVAKDLAPEDYDKYLNRSAGWQRIWHKNISSLNFTGFLAPTWPNGSVTPGYDPLDCGECEWSSHSYEALPIEYGWNVPFDMRSLIKFMGGEKTMEQRLDQMFVPGLRKGDVGSGGTNTLGSTTLFNPGNEPSFFTPFLYNYLPGRQWKSVLRLRDTVNSYYSAQPSGLPGNSDAGAIDSWLIWNFLGLYPVVTQPVYLLSSPWFDNVSVEVGDNSRLTITAQNLSEDSYFVQNVKVNGKIWTKSWVSHDDIKDGGIIEFVLGPEKKSWDTGELPPSPGHVELDL